MPRRGRLHIVGGYYHVIGRGLEWRYIFNDTEGKENFLLRLGDNLERSQAQCLAWAIMSNHYHLLIRVGTKPLASLMAPLLGVYGGYYNRRHRRSGYVFQNRYTSILCGADSYLLELVPYIHLNPLRANMIENLSALERYRWTGHAGMILGKHRRTWHEVDAILSLFGESRHRAVVAYRQFMSFAAETERIPNLSGGGLVRSYGGWETISRLRKEHISCIGDERIFGDAQFVEYALAQDELATELKSHLERSGWTLCKLTEKVCDVFDIEEQNLLRKARDNKLSLAKSLICYWGTNKLGLTAGEIARKLRITQPAVLYLTKKGFNYCHSNNVELEEFLP